MTEPIEYRTAIGDLARFVTGVRHARARLLLAAAIATDHATVPVTLGGPRFRIGLDVTAIELQSKCPGISLGEFDRASRAYLDLLDDQLAPGDQRARAHARSAAAAMTAGRTATSCATAGRRP